MTRTEAETLKVGDRVFTDMRPIGERHFATIIDVGYAAATAQWDDGQTGTLPFTNVDDIYLAGDLT